MMKRTDLHSESRLNPDDYEFVDFYDSNPEYPIFGEGFLEYRRRLTKTLMESNRHPDGSIHGLGTCAHCGANIRYWVIYEHLPTGLWISVGTDCADNRFSLNKSAWKRWKKEIDAKRALAKELGKFEAWKAASPENAAAEEFLNGPEYRENSFGPITAFLGDLAFKMNRYKNLSEKQVAAVLRIRDKNREFRAKREEDAKLRTAVVEGKGIEIVGTIISTKLEENQFSYYGGDIRKMLVEDDRNFRVWGTMPDALRDGSDYKGRRIRFIANVTKSDRDETFGFFKRPRKAEMEELKELIS